MDGFGFDSNSMALVGMAIVALILAVAIIKKVTGCLVKLVLLAIILGALALAYYTYTPAAEDEFDDPDAVILMD